MALTFLHVDWVGEAGHIPVGRVHLLPELVAVDLLVPIPGGAAEPVRQMVNVLQHLCLQIVELVGVQFARRTSESVLMARR